MTSKLLQFCETISPKNITKTRILVDDVRFSVPFKKESDNIKLELHVDQLLLSKERLSNFTEENGENFELTNIHPVHFTNSLVEENIYKFEDYYRK